MSLFSASAWYSRCVTGRPVPSLLDLSLCSKNQHGYGHLSGERTGAHGCVHTVLCTGERNATPLSVAFFCPKVFVGALLASSVSSRLPAGQYVELPLSWWAPDWLLGGRRDRGGAGETEVHSGSWTVSSGFAPVVLAPAIALSSPCASGALAWRRSCRGTWPSLDWRLAFGCSRA